MHLPEGFKPLRKVEKLLADKRKLFEAEQKLDWATGELLAYATICHSGYEVRMSGQDVRRGTFSHRHAILRDEVTDAYYNRLDHLHENQGEFRIYNSLLSEYGVLGFEYGYAMANPHALVVWEAQFGDFVNGAQTMIDQFISGAEQKWHRMNGVVLLLPHGYEGQGPEHSSARPERFLQLSAEHNIQVCVPTTPAQIYHLLRRQMVRPYCKPLVVMSPKSLLRHKEAVSSLEELAEGTFHNVIGEVGKIVPKKVRRVILCSGKVYYELAAYRREHGIDDVAIIRFEQLYPFPHDDFKAAIAPYKNVREVIWCQEEPQNQGAWYRLRAYFRADMPEGAVLAYAGRPVSASPAVGYMSKHVAQQKQLVEDAFGANLADGEMYVRT
jgi:2-oxoglutarate dehydrogenase E1 component